MITALAELQRTLAGAGADVNWVAPERLHVTLRFLGEITEAQREAVERALRGAARSVGSFELALQDLGAFPSTRSPRVIWVGIAEGAASLRRLADSLEADAAACSLPEEARGFTAHVTIGRVRSPRNRDALAAGMGSTTWTPPPGFRVTAVRLYQSVLGPAGPRYTVLAEAPLQDSGPGSP